jgi:hypothetical protein
MDETPGDNSLSAKKKALLVIGVVGLAFITSLILVFISRSGSNSSTALQPNPTIVPRQGVQIHINQSADNPLIPQKEISESSKTAASSSPSSSEESQKRVSPSPAAKTYDFKYELAPNLQHQKRTLLKLQTAYAAEPCSLETIPSTMPVFKLQQHLTIENSQAVAGKFTLPITAYSLPTEGGVLQYYYTDIDSGNYLSVMEPSGVYTFHHPPKIIGTPIDGAQASVTAESAIKEFFDNQTLESVSSTENPSNPAAAFVYKYQQLLAGSKIMDGSSVGSLETKSPCDMKPAESIGNVEMWLAQDGIPVNLFSKVRNIVDSKTLPILDLSEAVKQSEDVSYIDPIVFSKKNTVSGKVILDEAAPPVYIDPGPQFGLSCYIPVYQACGKTEGGDKVCPILPAVKLSDIKEYCAAKSLSGIEVGKVPIAKGDTIKYSHFPFNPPTPPEPPKIGQCGGGLVDYIITCNQGIASDKSLPPSCSAMISVPTNESPHTSVCENGCKEGAITGNVSIKSGGGDPCKQLLEDYNSKQSSFTNKIPLDKYLQQQSVPQGDYSCSVNICPC